MPSLSQRYRPRRFSEITGQRHVTETLRKEVATGVLGHAYLFCGPRGVGKTTAARILAKALNCTALVDGEPCNECPSCLAANAGKHMDIIEMDAATHTGVDMVREAIIEHVRFGPTQGQRKIYILDEAHMLSASSWNALLKTLEEPPPYAFFILATTEWHKVPATIISRCQRFEFKRISDADLSERIRETAAKEGWEVTDEVVALIVSRSEGCARDAETLLGQIGSLGEAHLDLDVANLVIPPSHRGLAANLLKLWAAHDHVGGLTEAARLFDEGIPALPLFEDLLFAIRRLLAAGDDPQTVELWKKGTEDERVLAELINKFTPLELNDLALLLFERRRDIKAGVDPLFALQLASTVAACGLMKHATPAEPHPSPLLRKERETDPPPDKGTSVSSVEPKKEEVSVSVASISPAPDLNFIRAKWNLFISAVEEKNHSLPFILKISRPESVEGSRLIVRFQYPFHRDKILSDIKNRRLVEECARQVFNCPTLMLEGVIGEDPGRQEERSNDTVGNILKAFGGQVVE